MTENNPITCRLVLYKGKPKGRVHLNRLGQASRSSHNRKDAQSQREPWLLGTSLPEGFKHAEKVVKLRSSYLGRQAGSECEDAYQLTR